MAPIFSTVVAVLAALLFEEWYAESALPAGDVLSQLPALALCLVPWGIVEGLFRYTRYRFRVGRPFEPRRHARWISQLPLPLYLIALLAFRWPEILVPLGLEAVVALDVVVVLVPFLLLLVVTMVQVERLKRPLRVTAAGFVPAPARVVRPTVLEQLRQLALPLAPMFVLLGLFDVVQDTRLDTWFDYVPVLSTLAILVLFCALLAGFPMFAKWALGMQPMQPDSPLRAQLEAFAAKIGFQCRDYLYWRTRRPQLNAALLGVWPRFRYVIFTEELLRRLTLEEIGHVFAHEAGHGTRHHAAFSILYTGVFVAVLLPISSALGAVIESSSGGAYDAAVAAMLFVQLPAFIVFWRVCVGPLSRRFELEADVEGARASGDARRFVDTLEKVGRVAHIERAAHGKRHFSIEGRAGFISSVFEHGDRAALEAFETRLRKTRRWIVATALAALLGVLTWTALDSVTGYSALELERGNVARATRLLDFARWWSADQPRAVALRIEAARYRAASDAVASEQPEELERAEPTWIESEARAALAEFRAGWSRAIVNERADVAIGLLDVAEELNALPHEGPREGEPTLASPASSRLLDPDAKQDLRDMREVAELFAKGDRAALRAFLSTKPRWLRRPDAREAAAHLARWSHDDSKTVSKKDLH